MAKITQIEQDEEIVYEMAQGLPPQAPKTDQEQTLEDMIGTLNDQSDNAFLSVYRQLGTGKESMSLVGTWAPDHFKSVDSMLLWLRDNYGGGSYRTQIRVRGRLLANKLLHVEAPITAKQSQSTDQNTGGILAAFMASQEKLIERLVNTKPVTEDAEMKFLEKMMLYKGLFQQGQSAVAGGIGQLKELIEVGQTLGMNFAGPAEEKEEGFSDILKNAMPMITAAITANGNQPRPHPSPQQKPASQPDMHAAQIKMGVNLLLGAAKNRKDPATYARMVDDQYGEQAMQVVASPDALQRMASYVPEVLSYAEWFSDLAEHVKAINGHPSKFDAEYADDSELDINSDDTIQPDGNQ